ncbi:MAG: Lrp/AsnC family transcriptional regulator [Candidatus Nitricoxidivorans perseverans]|uniref:siroheme decarboxylase n=1 Tax=Candidatus Nitricoxidivorans perseverans TaxID=2975601 RepID=A0AA49J073_9PROT|nr:MAG: Lrp/AsnC family transcriptional regulator [Candidatus Nitricoxidivorans perseverans]
MDCPYTPVEFRLLNDWQRDFPLTARPFKALALDSDEETVLDTLRRLHARGAVSRVGAVFAPRRLGASTLAALSVPAERMDEVAARVSARPEVNHNYEREHRYNLWFVVTTTAPEALSATLDGIALDTGCPVISLPLVEEFHIDLGFDLGGVGRRIAGHVCDGDPEAGASRVDPTCAERRLLAALQPGLDLVARPFVPLAEKAGMSEDEVIGRLSAWIDQGLIKRFGVVVRHRELGYTANAMVVFDVPDEEISTVGARLAGAPGVTLCYCRRRHLPEWPYNLFCMVHGRSRDEVAPIIENLRALAGHPCEALFSTRRFKQCGARYFDAARD